MDWDFNYEDTNNEWFASKKIKNEFNKKST